MRNLKTYIAISTYLHLIALIGWYVLGLWFYGTPKALGAPTLTILGAVIWLYLLVIHIGKKTNI